MKRTKQNKFCLKKAHFKILFFESQVKSQLLDWAEDKVLHRGHNKMMYLQTAKFPDFLLHMKKQLSSQTH